MARASLRTHTRFLWSIALLLAAPAVAMANRAMTLADTISLSTVAVMARISKLDDRAGLGSGDARTDITLDVEDVLLGKDVGRQLSLSFPVGVLPDGTIAGATNVPQLTKGDRYILFLQDAGGSLKIVKARDAILRVVSFPEKEVVVDTAGHGLLASRNHGFLRLRKIAESLLGRFVARASETQTGLEYHSQAKLSLEDVKLATELPEVLAFIRDMARYGAPRSKTVVELPEGTTPTTGELQQ